MTAHIQNRARAHQISELNATITLHRIERDKLQHLIRQGLTAAPYARAVARTTHLTAMIVNLIARRDNLSI